MTAYKLHWLLQPENEFVYLVTDGQKEECVFLMTAARPKKVSRRIPLAIDVENTFLLCETKEGRILWKLPVVPARDSSGKLCCDITQILRGHVPGKRLCALPDAPLRAPDLPASGGGKCPGGGAGPFAGAWNSRC